MKLVAFGEAMMRLSPPNFRRLEQAVAFDVHIGGAELNVAVGMARLGWSAVWVSRLPNNPLGRMLRNRAREQGVDTSAIVWAEGERLGVYYVEFGAAPRASSVLYDRAHSAISRIQPGTVDWPSVFKDAALFHTTGITPALSDSAAEATAEAVKAAKAAGLKVSYDLNYRAKLWSQEQARRVQTPLMDSVDILFTTEEDTERVFGIKASSYEDVARMLADRFGFEAVVITLRQDLSVWRNNWSALVCSKGQIYKSRTYALEIVDRLGGGDSCSAGFLSEFLRHGDLQKAIEFGVAFSALEHSIPGDFNCVNPDEVEALLKGAGLRIAR